MPNGDQRYDTHDYAGDRADDVSIAMRNMPQEDRSSNAELQQSITESQREELAPDIEMGSDRVVVPQNWESRTSTQLYEAATNKNVPTSADGLGRGFTEGGNRLAEAANRLLDAVTALEHAWKGEAADAARNALVPLATRTGQAGMSAQFMGTAMSDQALAAATVRNLPEPVEFDRDAAMTAAMANPNPVAGMADMRAKEQQAKEVKAEQVKYLTNYTNTMAEIDARTPTFVPPPARRPGGGGDSGFQDGRRVNYDGAFRDGGHTPGGGEAPGSPSSGFGPGRGGAPGMIYPIAGENGFENGTDLSGYTPPSTTAPSPTITPTTGPTPTTTGPGGPGPVGQFGGRGPGGTGPVGRPAPSSGLPPRPGAGGPGAGNPGAGRPGSGPGAGGRPGGGPGGPGSGPGTGGRPGAGGPAGAGSGGRGGGAGAGGRGGMGAGAGGRGAQGEEDGEHQRPSYLVEPDPEDTFGTDQITAPPVIGE